jgi:hypothetical protein
MSRIFFDHLVILDEVESEIKSIAESPDEKEELWKLVDDIVQHRVIITILDKLPISYHEEFLTRFHEAPHHEGHLGYLDDKIQSDEEVGDVSAIIKREIDSLREELLKEIKSLKRKK